MNKIKYLAAVMIGIAGLGLQQTRADIFTSSLTTPNTALQSFPGPYGTVNIDLDVATQIATITFTALGPYSFVDGGAADVNVSTSFDQFTLITDSDFKNTTSGNADGFGTFTLKVNNKSASVLVSTIEFSIHNTGSLWTSASDVLAFNSENFDAAAHISAPVPGGTPATGFVGEGPGTPSVPDGGTTVMLLGAALSALGVARRFLKT